ncbi:hypothetical protein EJ08DRAFT_693437 [Tothia fuscella]|uniref:DUF7703 domain-containing protein n=1 Tax=Tothia fuscella TaxID=1048955 RepID=A0A9P4NZW7_9PEZI|nr:hypothetical protein EJ08DRAFT_693437 [Tothia fuscella]
MVIHAITVWMALGVNVQLFITFKRRTTLYFWSILVTSWAIIICTICFDLRNFTTSGNGSALQWVQSAMWVFESVGFSFVLYSRLHLIVNSSKLKILPVLILCFDMAVHTVVLIGKAGKLTPKGWHTIIMFTPIFFSVQETFLSSLYVYLFIRFMRHSYSSRTKSMFRFLILGEAVVIFFDILMITLNSLHYEVLKTVLTPFFYAAKLKVEFMVLNRLMGFRQREDALLRISSTSGVDQGDRPRENSVCYDAGPALDSLDSDGFPDGGDDAITAVPTSTGEYLQEHAKQDNETSSDEIRYLERRHLGRNRKEEDV